MVKRARKPSLQKRFVEVDEARLQARAALIGFQVMGARIGRDAANAIAVLRAVAEHDASKGDHAHALLARKVADDLERGVSEIKAVAGKSVDDSILDLTIPF